MFSNLLIIESPNKIKTISKYLGKDFKIIATVGHIRDISSNNSKAFDQKTYEPIFKIIKKPKSKQPIVDEIKDFASKAKKIYLATDPDREGEAIAWHVYSVLSKNDQNKCVRITFNEITKDAIYDAFDHERQIEMHWVQSQFTRRILDRIIGYDLSKFVKTKYHGVSAGRVQSVVLKFLDEREKEINNFKPRTWFTIDIKIKTGNNVILRELAPNYDVKNITIVDDNEKGSGIDFKTEKAAESVVKDIKKNGKFKVYLIDPPKIIRYNSKDPYKTSTLQQDAVTRLSWNLSKTTKIVQDLYEGIDINGEHSALITYPRTDSVRISASFAEKAKKFIKANYGEEYILRTKRSLEKQKKNENVQDAHECIRVIDPFITPKSLEGKIDHDYFKLYELIWRRTLASLMAPCITEAKITRFICAGSKFYTYGRSVVFDGYRKVYHDNDTKKEVNAFVYKLNSIYELDKINITKHVSSPPDRFTQASLVKELDESGVGRPSTYKMMANIGLSRGYCELKNKAYYMTELGTLVIKGLNTYFGKVINKDFTCEMEKRLDRIAENKEIWNEWLITFAKQFKEKLANISEKIQPISLKVGRNCPRCNAPLVYRFAKKSRRKFIGCSNYPKCNYIEFLDVVKLKEKCPNCGGDLLLRTNKRKQKFIGCSNYPNCNFVSNDLEKFNVKNDQNSQK